VDRVPLARTQARTMSMTADPQQRDADRSPEASLSADRSPEAISSAVRSLPPGTVLRDYELRKVAASSPWSIVYEAWDRSLRRRVAVQEYRPAALASRRSDGGLEPHADAADRYALGLKAFVAEARLLARFDHPALLRIYRFWEERGTAYRAMPLHEGPTLERVLADGLQEEAAVRAWLRPVLDAVSVLHAAHAWHHHIVPRSIVVTAAGPVLLDMAAARRIVEALAQGPAAAADAGYAAIELDTDAATQALGPWTDLYALAAIAYQAFTGVVPPRAAERARNDRLAPLQTLAGARCSARFASAIDAALAVQPERRPRHDGDFRALAGGLDAAPSTLPPGVSRDLMSVPFLGDPRREVTVPVSTHPVPLAETDAAPRGVIATLPPDSCFSRPTRPVPFSPTEPRVPRGVWWGLVCGVVVLGAVAAVALRGFAHGSGHVAKLAPESDIASGTSTAATVAPPTPLTEMPTALVPKSTPAAGAVRTIDVTSAPRDEHDRHERCADLLQEATLRRLGSAESAFFKKECR